MVKIMAKYSELLLEIILQSKEHPTAEQIFMEAKKRNPKIVQATVYNNLKNLLAQGQVIRISNPGQPDRYDNTTRHDHMICTQCGELFDICLADLTSDIEKAAWIRNRVLPADGPRDLPNMPKMTQR